jgi:hypothetical protein
VFAAGRVFLISHPGHSSLLLFLPLSPSPPRALSPSVSNGVRISSFIYFKKILNEILTSLKTLLRMTEWLDEIATSLRSSQSGCVTIPFVHQEKLESGGHSTFIFSFWLFIPNITVKY